MKLKLLFVTHAVGVGGAAQSLHELIDGWDGVEADLVVPRLLAPRGEAAIRARFGPRVGRIFRCWLPLEYVYRGTPPLRDTLPARLLFPPAWRAERARFHRLVDRGGYDAVHLNSVVLHPLLRADQPFLFHVREILDDRHREPVRASAAKARAVIFIDEATRAPFDGLQLRRSLVINNPVDMTAVGPLPPDAAARLGGDPAQLTVFALVGALTEEKGPQFVIEAFRGLDAPGARLLLVGAGARAFERRLRAQAAGDPRIVFWGVEREVDRVYALTDHLLRAEPYACVGRTIYEALYAGCGVVVPGEEAGNALFEYPRFRERIRFYRPRDPARLRAVLASLTGSKLAGKRGASNVADYVARFDRFVREALGTP